MKKLQILSTKIEKVKTKHVSSFITNDPLRYIYKKWFY